MKTPCKRLLTEALRRETGGALAADAAERLLERGLVDLRACERAAVRAEIDRLARGGASRCGTMHALAEVLDCSYEKVRSLYYESFRKS